MNRRQFLLLVVTLIVLGGAGAALFWQDIAAYRASGAKIGARLLPDVKLSEVAQLVVRDAKSQATLLRKDNAWGVQERGAYPASVQQISELLIKLAELKVVQSETIGASLLPRVDLLEPAKSAGPGKPTEGSGTLVELKDASGKVLAGLILGKVVLKKDPGNPLPNAQDGVPAGRYIRNAGAGETVAVVSDPLSNVSADPGKWLARDYFKADRIKALAVSGAGEMQWKIARSEEWGQWKFAAGGGDLDASAAVGAVNALGNLAFADVVIDAKPQDADKPVTVTAETFDNLVYTLKIAKAKTGYQVSFALSGEPPVQRVPEKGEKPQDKEKRDKDFAENRKKLEARIAQEKALGKWTYVVEAKALAPLLRERTQLVAAKRPAR
ncbi:MAG: DUF4340 domain-containing protein [Pseudomonadota bacterium]